MLPLSIGGPVHASTRGGGGGGEDEQEEEEEEEEEEDDDVDEMEDRPRYCSVDPPILNSPPLPVAATHAEFSEVCRRGQLEQVVSMVEHGGVNLAEVDEDGKTVVHLSAGYRFCDKVLGYLLEKGADINGRDNVGATPLHAAASGRNATGVQLLLRFGAKVDARDDRNRTPLFVGCEAIAHRSIMELVKGGADPSLINGGDEQTALHALLHASKKKCKASRRKSRGKNGSTAPDACPLRETVDCLVGAGAPLTLADRFGTIIIDLAAAIDVNLVHHMLQKGNLETAEALSLSIRHGLATVAKGILCSTKADPSTIIDCIGSSLLHVAAAHNRLDSVQELLSGEWLHRADALPLNIDARDTSGRTALFVAAFNGFVDIAAFLLSSGASPAIPTGVGAGVGYSFSETVAVEQRVSLCELLATWETTCKGQHEQGKTSALVTAPDGDVILFPGVIPFVHESTTTHLWTPINHPPPPAGVAPPVQGAGGSQAGARGNGTSPYQNDQERADIFHPFGAGDHNSVPPTVGEVTLGEVEVMDGVSEQSKSRPIHRQQPSRVAEQDLSDTQDDRGEMPTPSPAPSTNEDGLGERCTRTVSEPWSPLGKMHARRSPLGHKERARRTLGSSTTAERMPGDDSLAKCAATEATGKRETTQLRTTSGIVSSSPVHRHRKLRSLGVSKKRDPARVVSKAMTDAATAAPSAPPTGKSSRLSKTSG